MADTAGKFAGGNGVNGKTAYGNCQEALRRSYHGGTRTACEGLVVKVLQFFGNRADLNASELIIGCPLEALKGQFMGILGLR